MKLWFQRRILLANSPAQHQMKGNEHLWSTRNYLELNEYPYYSRLINSTLRNGGAELQERLQKRIYHRYICMYNTRSNYTANQKVSWLGQEKMLS